MEKGFINNMEKYIILSNILVLAHEKDKSFSKENNICREGSAESLPDYTS